MPLGLSGAALSSADFFSPSEPVFVALVISYGNSSRLIPINSAAVGGL